VTPARWQQISQLVQAVLDQSPESRGAFLRQRTTGDLELQREVERLLAGHDRSPVSPGEPPAWGDGAHPVLDSGGAGGSLLGRQVGPYRVLEELGRGGMGVVYAADDERLGRTVAIKALPVEYTSNAKRRERLTREARAAAALSHPAIATVFALEEIDGALYIVSELVRGRTLRDELQDGPLAADLLMSTLCDIASALSAAHARGIVHRDLKPENVVRRHDGQLKVLDFGLARFEEGPERATHSRLTETGLICGTPGYMAPEQLAGWPADARADIFAFGVLAWELATGEHPFGADPPTVLVRMTELMEGRSATLSRGLPLPALDPIARKCLRARPEERYQSSQDLLVDLRVVTQGSSVTSLRQADRPNLWWWQFHQVAVSVVNTAVPVIVWAIRHWPAPPYGPWLFFTALALATISVTLRLNLVFTSRINPGALRRHRGRLFPAVAAAEAFLTAVLVGFAALIAGAHEATAALLLILAVAMLASLALVEPATTREAGLSRKPAGE
jgi:serine/threonine protein kinase